MERTVWTNWVGNQSFKPARFETAVDEAQVVDAVRRAHRETQSIRTAGSGHSFTPIVATKGVHLDMSSMRGVVSIDAEARTVSAQSQTQIRDFYEPLWQAGLALKNQGDIDTQAIAGAIATSTHGSGTAFGSFSSTLVGCRIVDGEGRVRSLARDLDPGSFPAIQCAIGTLGIMTEVTLAVMPAYHLHETILFMPADEVIERWEEFKSSYRHFSFFWMPTDHSSELYGFAPARADDCMVKLYRETQEAPGLPSLPGNERIDRCYRIYPHEFEPNFHELEYFLPAEDGLEVFKAHRELMLRNLPISMFPMEVRFVAADEAWISPNFQRDNIVISVSGKPGTDYWPYLKLCDAHLFAAGGRPHWGKLHFMTAKRMSDAFPRYEDFCRVRRSFDPKDLFLNDHLKHFLQ